MDTLQGGVIQCKSAAMHRYKCVTFYIKRQGRNFTTPLATMMHNTSFENYQYVNKQVPYQRVAVWLEGILCPIKLLLFYFIKW